MEEVRQMQEKLDGLQQKELQGDMARGRNTMNKSKFNKFDHVNMEVVLEFCKNKMFPIYKFLEQSMLIYSLSNKKKHVFQAYRIDFQATQMEYSY
jgi:hypothetical protein